MAILPLGHYRCAITAVLLSMGIGTCSPSAARDSLPLKRSDQLSSTSRQKPPAVLFVRPDSATDGATVLKLKRTDHLAELPEPLPPLPVDSAKTPPAATPGSGTLPAGRPASVDTGHVAAILLKALLGLGMLLTLLYALRHYALMLQRAFGRQSHLYLDVEQADWPAVTIVPTRSGAGHLVEGSLEAEHLRLFTATYPVGRITLLDTESLPLADLISQVSDDLIVLFDPLAVPGERLLKHLTAPFADTQVAVVFPRLLLANEGASVEHAHFDLSLATHYQIDTMARTAFDGFHSLPESPIGPALPAGTVALRRSALQAIADDGRSGWPDDFDDLLLQLSLAAWKIAYQPRAECHVPFQAETGPQRAERIRQRAIRYKAMLYRNGGAIWRTARLSLLQKLDMSLTLAQPLMGGALVCGWLATMLLFYLDRGAWLSLSVLVLALGSFTHAAQQSNPSSTAAALWLDGERSRMVWLPHGMARFFVNSIEGVKAMWQKS
ncbi:MAG: hypothetical protein ACK5NY_08925 [Burkholderiaceae bacterium]